MMAKVREQGDGLSGTTTRKSDGLTGTNATAVDQTSPPAAAGWRGRIGGLLAPRRTVTATQREAQVARPTRPPSRWGKLLFGFMVYLLGSFLLQPLILLIFSWLHINPAARQPFFPPGTWVVGTANIYTLVYFVFLAVFIWVLFRFNIIPRDPFGARANYERQRGGGASATSATTGASNGAAGSRASRVPTVAALSATARRHAGRRRLPMTDGSSTPAKTRTGFFARARAAVAARSSSASAPTPAPKATTATALAAKPSAKPATGATRATKPSAKPAASGVAKSPAVTAKTPAKASTKPPAPAVSAAASASKPAAKRSAAGTAVAAAPSPNHDAHYDRVKARQRAQRRKH